MKSILVVLLLLYFVKHAGAYENKVTELWKSHINSELSVEDLDEYLANEKLESLSVIDNIRLNELTRIYLGTKGENLEINSLSENEALTLASEMKFYLHLSLGFHATLKIEKARAKLAWINKKSDINHHLVKELFNHEIDHRDFYQGKYQDTVTLFLVCRKDRNYPCRFALKDIYGDFVKNEDDSLWTMPALAKSKYDYPYNVTSGQTPMGVHRIDSVMPYANNQGAFGNFRRIILNFVNGRNNDAQAKLVLPKSHSKLLWWKQASIARDVGRNSLRIHGTGAVNGNPSFSYYPHIPTSGCISTLEGLYEGTTYDDQRKILDKLMESSQLAPVYANEVHIKGLLFVLEIDDKEKAVSANELETFL